MFKLLLRVCFLLLSILSFIMLLSAILQFYFFISSDTSLTIVLGSLKFYLLVSISIILTIFINTSIFYIFSIFFKSITQKFITFLSLFSSILCSIPFTYFLMIKVETNLIKVIIISAIVGIIVPFIGSFVFNKTINDFIKPKLAK